MLVKEKSLSYSFPRIPLEKNFLTLIRYLILFQAHFFCKIQKNGYKVLYLSARAIGQVGFVNLIFSKLMPAILSAFQKCFLALEGMVLTRLNSRSPVVHYVWCKIITSV